MQLFTLALKLKCHGEVVIFLLASSPAQKEFEKTVVVSTLRTELSTKVVCKKFHKH